MKMKLAATVVTLGMGLLLMAQPASKVTKATDKAKAKTQALSEQSAQVAQDAGIIGQNIEQIIANAKLATKVFEPILRLRLRKKPVETSATDNTADPWQVPAPLPQAELMKDSAAWQQAQVYQQYSVQPADISNAVPIITQSPTYNADGTANLGNQNSLTYGCYINLVNGSIMDEIDAAGNSQHIDLIFTSTDYFNEKVPMYAFLTPAYARNDKFAYNFFKGTKYHDQQIPPRQWEAVNESEVAMTNLTGQQFERIQTNQQLAAVVKQISGFAQKVESRTKLDGKVLAVKTEMGNRTAYGLLYIVAHYGTFGENAYLKVKIKVTGFDATGDGNPDPGLYYTN
jgi:hypothetical protein